MKKNINQINKEALITIILYVFYFCWWYYFAFIYKWDNNTFIFGLPSWFFYSCVLGLVLINFLVFVAVKLFFKDIDLD
ncbi:MAG: YhdT family protein [Cetobacterium sp.]